MKSASLTCDVAVVGGGPVGLSTAIALAKAGSNTVLIAHHAPYADNRTTALLGGSIGFLQDLSVWERCREQAAPLAAMRLVDDTGRLIRAPEVCFCPGEIGLEAFGYNIENHVLVAALEARTAEISGLARLDDEAVDVVPNGEGVTITLGSGALVSARLSVGADGRHSLCRGAAGIEIIRRDLHQSALTFNIGHSRPHQNISTEFHTPQGPRVFVPLPGNRCSVVWVDAPKDAETLLALSDDELSCAVEKQSHSIFGRVQVEAGRHLFPLAIEWPKQFAHKRIALVGEAAHVIPPSGAQGLNLGLRDAADIAEIVREAIESGKEPGTPRVLKRYDFARRADVLSRTLLIDVANRSLISDLRSMHSLRAAGLHLIGSIGPLRRLAMREGLSPSWRTSPARRITLTETSVGRSG
ncbi:MAG: UbiH/UbiF family hydroxylase [Bradyrhizobium sp.]|nr:UbiH/UbiF family hydroxylase [Bradyrhizobium sp.]